MAKLLKLRRGSTSDHGNFTGAEGEVTVDTTKDTLVVHDGQTAGGHEMLREDMSNLPAGTIDNADVNASAAIAGTKISPNFGSQNIVTSGTVLVGSNGSAVSDAELTLSGDNQAALFLQRSGSGRFDCSISNEGGSLLFRGGANSASVANLTNRLSINGSTGNVTVAQSLTVSGGLAADGGIGVTGNVTVTGTVDGVDIAARNTLFGGLTSSSGVLTNGVTATTQSASDNSTKVATTAYTDTAIANLVDSSPSALNTLNELAAALGDDASFSTTVNNNIATKMPLAGGTFSGDITCQGGAGAVSVSGGSDIRMTGGSWTGDFTSGIKIQPTATDSYFQYHGELQFRKTNGTSAVIITQAGNLTASGNVTAYSDARLKENVETINDALGICGKLRGVSYKWKDMDKTDIGVIAQEVETVLPDIVLTNTYKDPADGTETEIKSVDYGKITSVLINAINELKAEVDALKGGS